MSAGWIARRAVCVLAAAFLIAGIAVALHALTFDHYGHAYGVSVGSDTHYCSIETAWPPVTCEVAR